LGADAFSGEILDVLIRGHDAWRTIL